MRVLGAILLGCALLLPATSSAAAMEKQQELLERAEDILYDLQEITEEEDALDGRVADNAETPTVEEEKENDEGLIMKKGCEDHQEGHEWGTSEHDNCYCQLEGPDLFRFCYHVDCLPGSEIVRDSKGLWDCPGGFSTADSSEKRANMSMLEDSLLQILEGEDYLDLEVADDEETPAFAEENDLDLRDIGTCKDGYQLKYRKCYKAFSIRKTWTDASAYCKNQGAGGNLAMPKDRNINSFLIQLKNAKSSQWRFWFGLNDRQSEGKWKWNDGTSLGSYNYWSPIEPNNGGKNWWGQYKNPEDCAEYFRKNWRNSNWNDAPCHMLRYFICERSPNVKKWRKDYRCGGRYTTAGGIRAECNPGGHAPCCSPHNWCGSTAAHCDCASCVDYRNTGK